MPTGYWRILAAVAGLAALFIAAGLGGYYGSLYSPDRKHYQAESGDRSGGDDYSGPSESLPDIAGLPGPVERAIANPRPYATKDNEERDLAAQEASALWAFWIALASFLTVVITGIGTIFIAQQVKLTREAVKDTGDATAAMVRQNQLTEAAQRPWITLAVSDLRILKRGAATLVSYQAEALNCGHEAAHDFILGYTVFDASESPKPKMDECLQRLRDSVGSVDLSLAPSERFSIGSWAFQNTNSIRPTNNMDWGPVIHPFVLLFARYKDSNGEGHEAIRLFRLAFETHVEKVAPTKIRQKAHTRPIEDFVALSELPLGPDRLRAHTIYSKTT